ncbi:MAG: adenylate/guanylate cyclase domain-containing protein [Chloroflexota bacterium]
MSISRTLIVDDNRLNRLKLSRGLEQQGHQVALAENGVQALEMLKKEPFDLVLLDILMPEMDGHEVLATMKADNILRDIPVIVISALDEMESAIRCIEMGAEEFLPKPFDPTLLKARIGACLEKKRWRDQEQAYLAQLKAEQEKSERLLLNILPKPIAERLKQNEGTIADSFFDVTVLFADIVGFTPLSAQVGAEELVALLNDIISTFDQLAEKHDLEKIKTIGDAYMVVGGLPTPSSNHAQAVADMALDMQAAIANFKNLAGETLQLRIGIQTGPVVAGIIGTTKFSYDLWGDTVNVASRMESHGIPGRIQVAAETFERLQSSFKFETRGTIEIKGKGNIQTYFLMDRKLCADVETETKTQTLITS